MTEMKLKGLSGGAAAVEAGAIEDFIEGLRGRALAPGDADYEAACALYNGMIDRRPALIVQCAGVGDVLRAVRFAREHQVLVSVRGGGHNVAGYALCDGGITIDLSRMRSVVVDPAERIARAEGGATWLDFDIETQAFDLATTGGLVSTTGIAGLTLGGGIGWLMRKHGLSCDNLIAADVVTGTGEFAQRERGGERGSAVGLARWRRQFRHRHQLRLSRASGQSDVWRGSGASAFGRARPVPLLPRSLRRGGFVCPCCGHREHCVLAGRGCW